MGLFSRHKKTEDSTSESAVKPQDSQKGEGASAQTQVNLENAPSAPPMKELSAPPMPKVSNPLEEIKSQVKDETPTQSSPPQQEESELYDNSAIEESASDNTDDGSQDDSLFDFSSSDLFAQTDTEDMKTTKGTELSVSEDQGNSEDPFELNNFEDGTQDTHMQNRKRLSFEENRESYRKKEDENFFMTTMQFKTMIEIVEKVKSKVQDSSNRHLKLLEIKSEEDLEYENLRRDFQYIEDKLYEIDSTIFNK